ncbi:huntingtin-interacting protein 1-related protein-like isoform X4 [Eriocheir sinensis]|uniref:huntingtin-interacting protein 1-related protein-like isoform X4 n=1 Tax=Eriocheir sinensis TaxID=95602 RepID=UPI0021C66006|nr:huntingtin-interacting protein 1-related protein-like isoform X4 [Eriocheir sinensis]
MTSIKKIPNVLGTRRSNTLDQERDQFEKSQELSFKKAVSDEEMPVKMKHVRSLIIGTYTDKNADLFWRNVAACPPINTDVTAWKFCHCLHVLFRDGHPNTLRDSHHHISRIKDTGQHFRHLAHGYGRLIKRYCELLIAKLHFHQHYPRFPGTMSVTPEELEALAENDANNYFELGVEMLEYLECILNLYEAVFASMDPSRANSMTRSGQCRLAPLIPCIQDSSCLYDCIVRILFQLHKVPTKSNPTLSSLPTDMLSGHRTRFYKQFEILKQFYNNTRNLQYFKGLIQVPALPEDPPNFLVEAELRSHETPVVVVEEQPDMADTSDTLLIDTSEPEPPPIPPHPNLNESHNGSLVEVVAERESLIEALHRELEAMRTEVQQARSQASHTEDQLRLRINDLESTIAELDSELLAERQSKESIMAQVEAAAASAEAVNLLAQEEIRRQSAEEKFVKMKDVYQKLRDEHIGLIRGKAEMDKQLCMEKEAHQATKQEKEVSAAALAKLQAQMALESQAHHSVTEAAKQEKESLGNHVLSLTSERDQLTSQVKTLEENLSQLNTKMEIQTQQGAAKLMAVQGEWEAGTQQCVQGAVDGAVLVLSHTVSHFDHEAHTDIKCTPEYTLSYQSVVIESVDGLIKAYEGYQISFLAAPRLVTSITTSAHHVAAFLLYAKATSHASPNIEIAEHLVCALEEFAKLVINTYKKIHGKEKQVDMSSVKSQFERCCQLVNQCEDRSPGEEDVAASVQREMDKMETAIRDAVERFTAMLENSRAKDTGTQLEIKCYKVNESILGTCSDLMAAVRQLVQRAAQLQQEIVDSGRGGASPKEFYKRNHRWSEGLLSGAKTVAIACQALMAAADQVVSGKGKFEEVIVSSREIAASSMQLVMASRVKAERSSQKMRDLNETAKTISTLTGTVVATAENCRDKVAIANTLDFSKLSLHHTKRMEMETLVKVLETEKQLETERSKLSELRKHHYKLAGEIEGWDQETRS